MKLEQLSPNHLFQGVDRDVLASAGLELSQSDFTSCGRIFEEGDSGHTIFLIVRGAVNIVKRGSEGKEEVLCSFKENDFFGEMAVLDAGPRSAGAIAETPCLLVAIDQPTFDRVLALAPAIISRNLTRTMVGRLRDFNDRFMVEKLRQERFSLLGSMVAGIIHDFRNPIATILTACELIGMRSQDAKLEKYCGTIQRSVERMTSMVQELLDFSRGSSGDLSLEAIDAAVLLSELEEQGLAAMAASGIVVEKEVSLREPVRIDLERMSRVLLNIIKNACEAMGSEGTFQFSMRQEESSVVFRLRDSGPGMEPETVARLFEPFFTTGKKGGTGLGLAIAKAVVDAHRGTILVQSAPGAGTMFEIRIPA